jgi:hypothetical protein
MDRRDLAIDLRVRLGDWQRVLAMAETGMPGDDALLTLARQRMGDHWADRQKWRKAIPYYEASKAYEVRPQAGRCARSRAHTHTHATSPPPLPSGRARSR